jgi:hypothetical protein
MCQILHHEQVNYIVVIIQWCMYYTRLAFTLKTSILHAHKLEFDYPLTYSIKNKSLIVVF